MTGGPKVFCIGFHKTGTTSLGFALTGLGYAVAGPNGNRDPNIAQNLEPMVRALAPKYDAFQDNPWPLVYQLMDQLYPGSKFILTVRDEHAWLKSCLAQFGKEPSPMRELIYGVSAPRGNEATYHARYRRHNQEVRAYFRDRPDDLLVMDMDEGFSWEALCRFLDQPIPDVPFPHAHPGGHRRW